MNICIISDNSPQIKSVQSALNINDDNTYDYLEFEQEYEFHDRTTNILKGKLYDCIVIPLSIPTNGESNTTGLVIALHIRLNYELDKKERLVPIVFLSNFTTENIIKIFQPLFDKDSNPQNLIYTKGIYFSCFEPDKVQGVLEKACNNEISEEYYEDLLNVLNVRRKAFEGNHDIANAWGCYKLSVIVGCQEEISKKKFINDKLKQLYTKYLICKSGMPVYQSSESKPNDIECSGKKILFIDDKSDEGWGELMSMIFKKAGDGFCYIKSQRDEVFNFSEFYQECQEKIKDDWDLIIVDLRLDPSNEDIDNAKINPTELSGYKLIDKILDDNYGSQIIVSTASNKVWNIDSAIKRGAAGYYIKESPESCYTYEESLRNYENFQENVKKAFDKSCFKRFVDLLDSVKNKIGNDDILLSNLGSYIRLSLMNEDYSIGINALNIITSIEKICKDNYEIRTEHLYKNKKEVICRIQKGSKWLFYVKIENGTEHNNVIDAVFHKDFKTKDAGWEEPVIKNKNGERIPPDMTLILAALRYGFNISEDLCKLIIKLKHQRNVAIAHANEKFEFSKEELRKIFEEVVIPIIKKL